LSLRRPKSHLAPKAAPPSSSVLEIKLHDAAVLARFDARAVSILADQIARHCNYTCLAANLVVRRISKRGSAVPVSTFARIGCFDAAGITSKEPQGSFY